MIRKIALLVTASALALSLAACDFQKGPTEPDYDQFTNPPTTEDFSNIEELAMVVTEDTIADLDRYPNLKTLDLSGSTCYAAIADYIEAHPDVDVTYTVSLGGSEISCGTSGLILESGSYDFITLINNLKYLPNVATVSLPKTDLPLDKIDALIAAYPKVEVTYSVSFDGQEFGPDTTELNLSAMDPAKLDQLLAVLPMMRSVETVELTDAGGNSPFTREQVAQLRDLLPNAAFNYTFELFGHTVSTQDEKLDFTNQKLGNEAEAELRAALDILPANAYVKVENCGFDNEVLGGIQQDYPEATIVWRVWYGNQNQLTDSVMIRHVYHLTDSNCGNMKYFTKAKYLDLGHNETLSTIEFCKYMPDLEILIVSGSMVSDLTPLANCTKLEWLELTYCSYVTDIAPLEGCVGLKCLNLGFTNVSDLTPVMDLELNRLHCILNQIPDEQEQAYDEAHPDTITVWRGKQPYGYGWRYDDDGYTFCEYYKKVREVFDLDAVDQRLKAQEQANKNK